MKVAYLISAHSHPQALHGMLSSLLNKNQASAFIHIDKKVEISSFLKFDFKNHNVEFINNRHFVYWSSFGNVKAQMELLKCALKKNIFDRFVFLSGLDFPVQSPDEIQIFFKKNSMVEFVGGSKISNTMGDSISWRINRWHLFRDSGLSPFVKRILMKATRSSLFFMGIKKPHKVLMSGKPIEVFTGSDWMAITKECAEMSLNVFENDIQFVNYFKTSFCPSEMFINTIVYNSKFKPEKHTWNSAPPDDLEALSPLHFIKYRERILPLMYDDYNEIVRSQKLFYRKSMPGISDELNCKIKESW